MNITEIPISDLDPQQFILNQVQHIAASVGDGLAINALSGGVDSSTVTLLAHQALGEKLKTYFIDSALMRKGEPQQVVSTFARLGVSVELIDARQEFLEALQGITDPEQKREAVTQTFYKKVFGRLVRASGAKHLLQGTILTDVDETVAGIKRQHNVFEQLGIDPQEAFGYKIIEPLIQLRKDGVRKVAQALGLPASIYGRMPFPGPGLAARVIGEVTAERLQLVRQATAIVEAALSTVGAFQCMAILHEDRVTGIREGRRQFGCQIEVRCWESIDARAGRPTHLPWDTLDLLSQSLLAEIPAVVSVTYNIAPKPPSTMEAV
ncbi:MAG: ExsB family transcriptional regulator [Acidobacteriia bacterium]|nr:ExsB family transcriptional regulator [Terriglobia bacterium]